MASGGGGGLFGAIGQLVQGRQQRNQIDVQRDIEQFNIKTQEQNAALTGQQTSAREEQVRRSARRALGAQRAAVAQSGTGMGGSNAALMAQSAGSAELDALNVRYAGTLERLGILNDIEMRRFNDKVLKKQGKQAMRMRWFNAASSFFGGSTAQQQPGQAMPTAYSAYGQAQIYNAPATTSSGANWMNGYGTATTSKGWGG